MPYFKALPPVSRRPLSAASSTQVTPRHARRFIQPADSRRAPSAHELMVESNAIIAEVQALVSDNTEKIEQNNTYTTADSKQPQQRMDQRFNRNPLLRVSSKSHAVDDGLTSFEALIASLLLEYGAIAFGPLSSVEAAYVACLDRSKSRKRTEEGLPQAAGSTEEDPSRSKGGSSALLSNGSNKKETTLIKPLPLAEEGLLSDLSIKAIAAAEDAALLISKRKGHLARPSSSPPSSSLLLGGSGCRGFTPYGADASSATDELTPSNSSARLSARERSLRRMYYTPPPTVYMDKGGLSGVRASVRGTSGGMASSSSSAAAATGAEASSESGNGSSSTSAAVESLITSAFTQMLSSGGRRGFSFDISRGGSVGGGGHRSSSLLEASGGNGVLGEEATAVRRALATAGQFPVGSVGYILAMTAAARIVFTYHSLAASAFPSSPANSSRAVGGAHHRHGSKGKFSFSSVSSLSGAPESPLSSGVGSVRGGGVGGVHSPTRKTIGPAKGVSFFLTQHPSGNEESLMSKNHSKETIHPPLSLSVNALAAGIHHHVGEPEQNQMVSVPPSSSSPLVAAAPSTLVESFVKAWRSQACIFLPPADNNENCGGTSQNANTCVSKSLSTEEGITGMSATSRRMSAPQGARCLFLDPFNLMQNGTMKSAALFWQQHCPPRNPVLLDKHTMQLLRSVSVPASSAVPHPPSPRQASTPKTVSVSGGLMMPNRQGRVRSVLAAYIRRPVVGKEMEIKATKDEVLNLRRVFNEVQLHLPELARLQQQKRINLESEEGQALCLADIFSLIDTDSSGEVDEDEFVAFGHRVGGETAKVFSRRLFRRILTPSEKRPVSRRDAGGEDDARPSSPSREGQALPNSPRKSQASSPTPRSTTFASSFSNNGGQQQQHVYSSYHNSNASHVMRPPSSKPERSGITLRELQTLLFPNYAKAVVAQEAMAEDRRREVTTMPRQWQDTFDARDIEELHRTFCEIDADGNGCISATELAVYCEGPAALASPKTGGAAPLKRYEEHLKRFDTNGDGFIDFREFAEMQRYYLDTTRGRVRQNGEGGGGIGVGGAAIENPALHDTRHSFNGGGIQPPQWLPYYD